MLGCVGRSAASLFWCCKFWKQELAIMLLDDKMTEHMSNNDNCMHPVQIVQALQRFVYIIIIYFQKWATKTSTKAWSPTTIVLQKLIGNNNIMEHSQL